jgi:hypothetical protein
LPGGFAGGADGLTELAPGQVGLAGGVDGLGEFLFRGGSGASKSSGAGSWFSKASANWSAWAIRSVSEGRMVIT